LLAVAAAVSRALPGRAAAVAVRADAHRSGAGRRTRRSLSGSHALRAALLSQARAIPAQLPLARGGSGGAAAVLSADKCAQGGAHRTDGLKGSRRGPLFAAWGRYSRGGAVTRGVGSLLAARGRYSSSSDGFAFRCSISRINLIHSESLRRSVREVFPVRCCDALRSRARELA